MVTGIHRYLAKSIDVALSALYIDEVFTPSEFVRDLIRQNKERRDAEALRQGILDGYQGALRGRVTLFEGDLRSAMRRHKSKRGK